MRGAWLCSPRSAHSGCAGQLSWQQQCEATSNGSRERPVQEPASSALPSAALTCPSCARLRLARLTCAPAGTCGPFPCVLQPELDEKGAHQAYWTWRWAVEEGLQARGWVPWPAPGHPGLLAALCWRRRQGPASALPPCVDLPASRSAGMRWRRWCLPTPSHPSWRPCGSAAQISSEPCRRCARRRQRATWRAQRRRWRSTRACSAAACLMCCQVRVRGAGTGMWHGAAALLHLYAYMHLCSLMPILG